MDIQIGYLIRGLRADLGMVLGRLSNDDLLEIQQALGKFLDERFAEDRVEVVINRDYGGFGISDAAKAEIMALGADPEAIETPSGNDRLNDRSQGRSNPALVATVKKLGKEANAPYADLTIVSIPRHLSWRISNYDGYESIAILHPTSSDVVQTVWPLHREVIDGDGEDHGPVTDDEDEQDAEEASDLPYSIATAPEN